MILAKTFLACAREIPLEISEPVVNAAYRDTEYEEVETIAIEDASDDKPRIALSKGVSIGKKDM